MFESLMVLSYSIKQKTVSELIKSIRASLLSIVQFKNHIHIVLKSDLSIKINDSLCLEIIFLRQ
jgi:hypothetical protein